MSLKELSVFFFTLLSLIFQNLSGTGQSPRSCKADCKGQQDSSECKCHSPNDVTTKSEKRLKKTDVNDVRCLLWVSNLADDVKAANLKDLFGQHGRVISTKIVVRASGARTSSGSDGADRADSVSVKQQRCGLVQLASLEAADRCLEQLNKTEFHGLNIYVGRSQPRLQNSNGDKNCAIKSKPLTLEQDTSAASSLQALFSIECPATNLLNQGPQTKTHSQASFSPNGEKEKMDKTLSDDQPPMTPKSQQAPWRPSVKPPKKSSKLSSPPSKKADRPSQEKPSSCSSKSAASREKTLQSKSKESNKTNLPLPTPKSKISKANSAQSKARKTLKDVSSSLPSQTSGSACKGRQRSRRHKPQHVQQCSPPPPPPPLPTASVRSDDLRYILESARCARSGIPIGALVNPGGPFAQQQPPKPLMSLSTSAAPATNAAKSNWQRHQFDQPSGAKREQELEQMERRLRLEQEQLELERLRLRWERERAASEERRVLREQEDYRRLREEMERELREEWERKQRDRDRRYRERNPRSRSRSRSRSRGSRSANRHRDSLSMAGSGRCRSTSRDRRRNSRSSHRRRSRSRSRSRSRYRQQRSPPAADMGLPAGPVPVFWPRGDDATTGYYSSQHRPDEYDRHAESGQQFGHQQQQQQQQHRPPPMFLGAGAISVSQQQHRASFGHFSGDRGRFY